MGTIKNITSIANASGEELTLPTGSAGTFATQSYVQTQVQTADDLSELGGTLDDISDGSSYVKMTNAERTTVGNQTGTNSGDEVSASTTVAGVVELATTAETNTGTIANRVVTVVGLKASGLQSKVDNIDNNANNYSHPNHSGDVTSSGDGATTIANDAVTYAKMQNVSATDRILGRDTAGAGDVEEITPANVRAMINVEDGSTADQTDAEIRTAVESATDSNVFTDADHSKLDGIEASADVTDTANVTSSGALMDSELTSIADVKALNQSVVSGATPTFTTTNFTDATDKRLMTDAQETILDSVETNADVTDATNVNSAGAVMESDISGTPSGSIIDDDTMATASNTTLATSESVKAYVDSSVSSDISLKGDYNASTDSPSLDDGTPISGILKGDHYVVSVAGTFFTESLQAGDSIIAKQDSPTTLSHWILTNNNLVTPITNNEVSATASIALSKLATDPLARANHTGTQTASTISDFDTEVENNSAVTANTAKLTADTTNVVASLTAGTNVAISAGGTISSTDTNTTYTSSDFTHNSLSGVTANEHIDWTADQGATNIHSGNYTDTDTVYTHPTTAGNKHIPTGGSAGQFLKYSASGTAVWAADNNTVYTHPTTAGNKHIPTGGAAGQFLKYSASGTAVWAADNNTVYTHPTTAGNKHIPTGGAAGQFLKYSASGTAVWASDNNTTYSVGDGGLSEINFTSADHTKLNGIAPGANAYTHPTTAGNKHIPTGGAAGQFLKYSSSGTAVWAADNNTTYSNSSWTITSLSGFNGSTSNYLRGDGSWVTPPDNNTTYSNSSWTITSLSGFNGSTSNYLRGDGNWVTPPDNNTQNANEWSSNNTLQWSGSKNISGYVSYDYQLILGVSAHANSYGMIVRGKTGTSLRIDGGSIARFYFNANGSSSPTGMSDRRNKRNISEFSASATNELKKLDGKFKQFNFIYNDDESKQELDGDGNWEGNMDWNTHHGLLAQDVQALDGDIAKLVHRIHPDEDYVSSDETDSWFYLDYEGLSSINSKAILELDKRITALENL